MNLSELVKIFGDVAEIAVTILMAFVVYKIAILVDTLSRKIKRDAPL